MRRISTYGTVAAGLAVCAWPGAISAQEPASIQIEQERQGAFERYGGVPDHFNVKFGLFFPKHGTLTRLDSEQLGAGTLVDLEADLGLAGTTRNARVDGYVRLGRRHLLRGGYVNLDRGAAVQLQRSIQFGSEQFDVDVAVESFMDLSLFPANYRFAFIKTDRVDVGVSAGVFALFLDAGLSAPEAGLAEAESVSFPLPVLGADFEVAPAPRIYLQGGVEYFGLKVQGVDGSWLELRASLEYFPVDHVGVGGGYRYVDINVDATGSAIDAGLTDLFLEYGFHGPQAYVTFAI